MVLFFLLTSNLFWGCHILKKKQHIVFDHPSENAGTRVNFKNGVFQSVPFVKEIKNTYLAGENKNDEKKKKKVIKYLSYIVWHGDFGEGGGLFFPKTTLKKKHEIIKKLQPNCA